MYSPHVRAPAPSSLSLHTPPPTEISLLLVATYDRKRKGLWVAIPSLSSHAINLRLRVLPALGSPAHSAEVQLAQLSDGNLTAKEMHPGINESALMRRIDIGVISVLCMAYLFAYLDRVNIANAAVYGMGGDLGLVGNQYNVALTIL